MKNSIQERRFPTAKDDYFFDLRGYLILKNALSKEELYDMNAFIDTIPETKEGESYKGIYHQPQHAKFGTNYQQIYEAPPFRKCISHPSWIEMAKHYVGGKDTFDWHHGPIFIDENFLNLRSEGQAISLHSGGHEGIMRTQFRYYNGGFHCGQINILLALNNIGPGDGATMVIPGSHKSNFEHPQFKTLNYGKDSVDVVEGAIEVHLKAGDALLFVDAISHGSAARTNSGQRRICVFRYGPSWGNFRFHYRPSGSLLEALNPEERQIVSPAPIKKS